MVNKSVISSIRDLPFELVDCQFIIITHRLGEYLFSDDECYKGKRQLSMIRCGGSNGYKINGTFKSLTWLRANRKRHIEVLVKDYILLPF